MYRPWNPDNNGSNSPDPLPPFHAFGQDHPKEEDRPPDISLGANRFAQDDNKVKCTEDNLFDACDAAEVCKLLKKGFYTSGPGCHVWRRRPDHGGSFFVHCHHAAKLSHFYARLQQLLKEKALTELLRDCVYRLHSFQKFIDELESILKAEYKTAYSVCHGFLLLSPVSKLHRLNVLCEDLHAHVGHWDSIKQRLNSCHWLKSCRGALYRDLTAVHRTFALYIDRAIFVMNHLIQVGFEVLAHSELANLTSDILWNIFRGLEEFNNIVSSHNMNMKEMKRMPAFSCAGLSPAAAGPPNVLNEGLRAIYFIKVLASLANERSRYAAKLVHQYFTANEAFISILSSKKHDASFHWEEDWSPAIGDIYLHCQIVNEDNTPEQHSNQKSRESHTSLDMCHNSSISHIGAFRVPDLPSLPVPLKDFLEKERQFMEKLLKSVSSSTSLLQNDAASTNRTKSKHRSKTQDPTSKHVESDTTKTPFDIPVSSRSRRKTVSWGDDVDNSLRSRILARYMRMLWHQFGCNLDLFLDEPAWRRRRGLLQSKLGSVLMLSDTAVAVLRHMISRVCLKDSFPTGIVSPLLGVVLRLHALSAFAAWDFCLCGANSSQGIDRCQPCPTGQEDVYSTQSALHLLHAYNPLMSLLQSVCSRMEQSRNSHYEKAQVDMDLSLVSSISSRLLSNCLLAHMWCTNKLHGSFAALNIKVFVFISSTDLPMLRDIGQQMCQLLHTSLARNPKSPSVHSVLDDLCLSYVLQCGQHVHSLVSQLQTLEHSCQKQFTEKLNQQSSAFFKEHLPMAKLWRRRTPPEFPEEASSYVEGVWGCLVSPMTEALTKLSATTQLAVLHSILATVAKAWMAVFLKNKIKISYYGAHQLSVDFDRLRSLVSDSNLTEEVRTETLELSIFRHLNGVIQLLKQQPTKRPTSRFRTCSTQDYACDSRDASPSHSSSRSELPTNMEQALEDGDVCMVPNPQEWLALRVIGGSRIWRLPTCFRKGADS